MSKKTLITGALTLTVANIVTRLIGFVYRIFMAGAIGAEGMGLYQLIMPIYTLAWAISCSGITTTLSRLVAAEKAKGQGGNMRRLLAVSLLVTAVISVALTGALFFAADFIGSSMVNDQRIVLSLRILSASIIFMAAGSCIRGYFLGLQKASVIAVSQVIEQVVRMAVILMLASLFIPRGLHYAAAVAVIGIVAGETLSFVFVYISYRFHAKKSTFKPPTITKKQALGAVLVMATPLTLNRITSSFLSMVENVLIPRQLQLFGLGADEAMAVFGQITGMAMPLIFFPSAILTALSISLVPSISDAATRNNLHQVNSTISKSIVFTSIVAFGSGLVFVVFPHEIGQLVYRQDLSRMLLVLGLICPFWYLNITFNGILNGLGQQMFIFRNSLMASIITILFVFFLVPVFGIPAFLMGWFISLIIVTAFDIHRIKRLTKETPQILRWFAKPALAAAASGLLVNLLHNSQIAPRLGPLWGLLLSLTLLIGLYIAFIILLKAISVKEIRQMTSFKK